MSSTTTEVGDAAMRLHSRPRARILQLLGDETIGSPRVAVFELVKNATMPTQRSARVGALRGRTLMGPQQPVR